MILRISILLLLLLAIPAFYLDRHFRLKNHRFLRGGLWGLTAALLAFTVWFCAVERFTDTESQVKGIYLMVLLTWGVSALVFCALSALGSLWRHSCHRTAARHTADITALILALALAGCMIYGNQVGPGQLTVKHFTYRSPLVPQSFKDFRIVQLADLHVGTFSGRPELLERLTDSVLALRPDLIVFTGDMVNYHSGELDAALPFLRKLKAPFGIYAVLGNHDYMNYRQWPSAATRQQDVERLVRLEQAMGWHVLRNAHAIVRKDADSLAIIGVENDGQPPFPALADLPRAVRGLQPECFSILLSHDPTHWRRSVLPETDIPLMLSGHTHGMQLRIGDFSPAQWIYPEWGGPYHESVRGKERTLYVSLGFGEVLLPFRLGAWPEINVITLQCE